MTLAGRLAKLATLLLAATAPMSGASAWAQEDADPAGTSASPRHAADNPAPAPARRLDLPPAFAHLQDHLVKVAEAVSPSVAAVRVRGRSARTREGFSAVVVREDGYLLTNAGSLQGAHQSTLDVLMAGGRRYQGRFVAEAPASDLALIKIDAQDLPTLELGDSDRVRLGQFTLSLGNPFGLAEDGYPAVNFGIVGGVFRVRPVGAARRTGYTGLGIQTTAHLNPGSQGGPLVDLHGRLIGLNGALTRQEGTGQTVSYAVPVNQIKAVLPALLAGKPVPTVWLGFTLDGEGAVETLAADSAAARAGLREFDEITHIDDAVVTQRQDVERLVRNLPPGTTVVLRVQREDGSELEISVPVVMKGEGQ